MPKESPSKGVTLLFGCIFAFAILRTVLIADTGAWMLLLLPTVGLPVYFYGRMFYLALTEKAGAQPPSVDEIRRQIKSGDRESNAITIVFFALPLVVFVSMWLYRASNPPHDSRMATQMENSVTAAVSQSRSAPLTNAGLANNAPMAPLPEHRQPRETLARWYDRETLTMWYEQLLLERQELNPKDLAAVHVFNAHVAAYNTVLKEQQQPTEGQ